MKVTNATSKRASLEEVEKEIHARAAFAPVHPGEEDNLDEVKATVEALVHSRHLTAGQAFSLCSQLDSSDPVEQVSAREIIAALHAELADPEPESENPDSFDKLFPAVKSAAKVEEKSQTGSPAPLSVTVKTTQIVSSQSAALTKLPPLARSADEKKKGSKSPQVDPRLDVMCSLMSTDGLKKFLESQYIVPEDETMTRHEDLHCLALASAVPPASSSNNQEDKKASK
ncbi:Chaperone protein DnaJ [Phytophthora cinnamomi]|uniref:Chaperone protein DnaJ n=1 Tax=Phytophthora cinnamomi TaxID=4785 RepID=UPI00355AA816|nr:Chaperone protein DnaJ [Phytophthora cinnamomi]